MGVIAFSILGTVFGFVPTGLVALALAAAAFCVRHNEGQRAAFRRQAMCWCWITVGIGILIEAPVVAAIAMH